MPIVDGCVVGLWLRPHSVVLLFVDKIGGAASLREREREETLNRFLRWLKRRRGWLSAEMYHAHAVTRNMSMSSRSILHFSIPLVA